MHEGMEIKFYASLRSVQNGTEWSAARYERFTPGKIGVPIMYVCGWVSSSAIFDAVKKRK
jgi:hypothetical protein